MRSLSVILLLLMVLSGCNQKNTTSKNEPINIWKTVRGSEERLELLLPPGEYRAELMRLMAPDRLNELSDRLAAGMRANPQFVMDQLAQLGPGEPIPYDARLGMTADEYAEYSRLADEVRLAKYDEATASIERDQSGEIVLHLPVDSGMSAVVTLDAKQLTAKTAYGDLASPSDVVADPKQFTTGPWNGYHWRNEVTPSSSGPQIKLYMGQLAESKKRLVIYEVREISTGKRIIDLAMHLDRLPESTVGN